MFGGGGGGVCVGFFFFFAGHRWSYNLTEAADYFAGYRAIMRHWQEDVFAPPLPAGAAPLPLLEVRAPKSSLRVASGWSQR